MLDTQLLDILVCPETKQRLVQADAETLDRVNAAISAGSLTTRSGAVVSGTLSEALIREDRSLLYPVRDDIPIMLVDESIELDQLD